MTDAARVVRSEQPLTAMVGREVVMLAPNQGAYFGLNEVGTRVWELLERPRSIDEVCSVLQDEFEVDAETCRREVLALLDQLREASLVRDAA